MSTTVRITKKDKDKLDQLTRYLSFKTRRKITQEELLASLIASGEKQKDELEKTIVHEQDDEEPIDESDPFFKIPSFSLGKSASKDHDKAIYGDE